MTPGEKCGLTASRMNKDLNRTSARLIGILLFSYVYQNSLPFLPEVIVFYMSIAEFEHISLTLGIGGLMLLMIFILHKPGKDSGADKFGTFVLFLSLGMGIFGFAAKSVIKLFIDI